MRRHIVPATSLEAYANALPALSDRQEAALAFVKARYAHGATRYEIGEGCRIPYQSVCSVALSLLDAGLLRETTDTRPTPTGSRAAVLVASVPPSGTQLGLLTTPEARVR